MQPLTFNDAREAMAWEAVEKELSHMARVWKEKKKQRKAAAHKRWKRHWRTRLANALRSLVTKIELPEPPLDADGRAAEQI